MFLPFRLSPWRENRLPLHLYSIGSHVQQYQTRPHGYPAWQIFFTIEGSGSFSLSNQRQCSLQKNQLLIIPEGQNHEYKPIGNEDWLLAYVGFTGDLAQSFVYDCQLPLNKPITIVRTTALFNQIEQLWNSSGHPTANQLSIISVKLYEFLVTLLDKLQETEPKENVTDSHNIDKALQKAIHYMNNHYTEKISIANIANVVGYSPQHFQKLFKNSYGTTPHTYLQRIRMQQAKLWLEEDTTVPIKEIAWRLGMEPNYFNRIFKEYEQITPKQYRQQLK
ncbi:AraC family transcriptional regulator [Paenibacillus yanchengensis]|uniref:AraC family transcriptional regulator n=1 Tax=Paenibacillus yanchengensis TaxID=2035833 RepID=A0ABW4YF87_9BACL